jgi:hypothetical protein
MRKLAGLIVCLALLGAPGAASAAPGGAPRAASLSAAQTVYLGAAAQGLAQAKSSSAWWNRRLGWFNGLLSDSKPHPLATLWQAVPMFETVDYVALADPTPANLAAVHAVADYAQRYRDRNIRPAPGARSRTSAYAPYPGSWNNATTYFDDNGWWSLAFLDASAVMTQAHQATLATRYLRDAERGFQFIDAHGWDSGDGGGMWWNTAHTIPGGTGRSGEALAAATDLAARLYQVTRQPRYLQAAELYITWANHNILKWDGSYAQTIAHEVVMPHDGEGAMVSAFTALCETGAGVPLGVYSGLPTDSLHRDPSVRLPPDPGSWCSWAESLAVHTALGVRLGGRTFDAMMPLNEGPQWDAIYLRGLLALNAYDHNPLWYALATATTTRILTLARGANGLFLLSWSGSSSVPGAPAGDLQTDASSLSVLAAMAATPPPGVLGLGVP